jgi:hypothetical protein
MKENAMSTGGLIQPKMNVREQAIRAVVTRADGTVEDMGLISYYHKNPIKRLLGRMRVKLSDLRRK